MKNSLIKMLISLLSFVLLVSCKSNNFIKNQDYENIENSNDFAEDNFDIFQIATKSDATLSKYSLPVVGKSIYGFKVESIYDFEPWNAKIVDMEHEKTGMKVFLVSNADEDKSFVVGVRTKAEDDRGIPHVFEHATIDSTENYPAPDGFFSINGKLYTTFLNACTTDEVTFYPVSSLSDEQLYAIYKYYIDGLFNPMILKENRIFDKEAARYILYDKDADIKISGAAYNEMSSKFSDEWEQVNVLKSKAIFENGHLGNNSGGDYRQMINITHQDLIDFHEKYYHPSNMCMYLYGDINYEKYLKLLNENYLKKYDKKEIIYDINDYVKNTTLKDVRYDLPVAKDFDTKDNTIFNYAIRFEDITSYEVGLLDILVSHFLIADGKLQTLMQEKLPKANVDVEFINTMSVPVMIFTFEKVNHEDKSLIKNIIDESINDLIINGISKDLVNMRKNDMAMSKELEKDSHGFARKNDIAEIMQMTFRNDDENKLGYFLYRNGKNELEKTYEDNSFKDVIDKYFKDRNDFVIIEYNPKPGLLEEIIKIEDDKLLEKQKNMTEEEKEILIEKNIDYDKWLEEAHNNIDISEFVVASVSSLDVYNPKINSYEENREGIRFIKSLVDDFMFSNIKLCFDAKIVSYDDLHKLSLLAFLINDLPTDKQKGEELLAKIHKKVYDYDVKIINIKETNTEKFNPYFTIDLLLLDKNLDDIFALIKERLFETKFDDINVIRNKLPIFQHNFKNSFNENANGYAENYYNCIKNTSLRYDDYVFGASYLKFIDKVLNMSDEELKVLIDDMSNIFNKLLNKNNMVCEIISNPDTSTKIKNLVMDLSVDLTNNRYGICDYDKYLDNYKEKTGLTYDGVTNYTYIGIYNPDNNITITGKHIVIASILNDIIYEEYRAKRGAYGAKIVTSRKNSYLYTYHDPNVKESIDVARTIPYIYDNLNLTEEELENYKLNAYSKISYPKTKLSLANIALTQILTKDDENDASRYARYMREIKEMTLDDVKNLSRYVHMIFESPIYTSVGNDKKINDAKDYFDVIRKIDNWE